MKSGRKQNRREGDVFEIILPSSKFAYGRVLKDPTFAFYDLIACERPALFEIISARILFKVWVMKYAITSGKWHVIGNAPLSSDLQEVPRFYKQDPITDTLSIYHDDEEYPASKSDCVGLECAAVWEPEHVEERLNDHFAGVSNIWLESLRIR